jgi:hypothetical protein
VSLPFGFLFVVCSWASPVPLYCVVYAERSLGFESSLMLSLISAFFDFSFRVFVLDRGGYSSQVLYTPTSAERTGYSRCGRATLCHLDTGGAEAWSGIPFALFPPFLRGEGGFMWPFRAGYSSQFLYTPTSAERTGYSRCGRATPCYTEPCHGA